MKYLLLIGTLITVLNGCSEESVDIPDYGRRIVVNSLISTNAFFNLSISKSAHINNYDDSSILQSLSDIDNASVIVYQNGKYVDSLFFGAPYPYDINKNTNYYSKHLIPQSGNRYEIKVRAPNLPDASAATFIPSRVDIDNIDTTHIYTNFNVPDWPIFLNVVCHINFTDPSSEKNYYLFDVYSKDQPWSPPASTDFDCKDPVVEEKLSYPSSIFLRGIAFTDKIFNGKKYTLDISIQGPCIIDSLRPEHDRTIFFHLYSITEEYYRYIHAINLYKENKEKAIFDPVQIPSNITGGLGFFSGAAVATDSIIISKSGL